MPEILHCKLTNQTNLVYLEEEEKKNYAKYKGFVFHRSGLPSSCSLDF